MSSNEFPGPVWTPTSLTVAGCNWDANLVYQASLFANLTIPPIAGAQCVALEMSGGILPSPEHLVMHSYNPSTGVYTWIPGAGSHLPAGYTVTITIPGG